MQWTKSQKNVVVAAYLGWTLDAFDFFLMVFMFKDIASTFHVDVKSVVEATFLTLAARPIGAFVFGRLADRFGRKPTLMWNILAFSVLEGASGFAPSLTSFLAATSRRWRSGHRIGAPTRMRGAATHSTRPVPGSTTAAACRNRSATGFTWRARRSTSRIRPPSSEPYSAAETPPTN